jgi:hypothetical protein
MSMIRRDTEIWFTVPDVARIMGCSYDTARSRMQEMTDVINVGSAKRRQLMVPENSLQDWFRNHRIAEERPAERNIKIPRSSTGKIARIDRRTGKLKAV